MTKPYYKLIVSGDIYELYEYENPPTSSNLSSNDDYNALDLETTELVLEEKEDRSDKRRQQTVRDARNTVRRLALTNFTSEAKFITLTFKENVRDISYADNEFKKFIKRLKYRFSIDSLKYIAVREFQKRGAIHYHMICDWDLDLVNEEEIRYYERLLGTDIWGHGFVDIKPIDHVDNVGAYIIKYMTKNVAVEFFKGKKIYLPSKGLDRPMEYRGDIVDEIIKALELNRKKEVFTNSYESEYLGKIVYKEYNMKRQ